MIFLTVEQVIDFHTEIINEFGGAHGIREMGLLISAIEMPKASMFGEFLHVSVYDKAAAYLYHIVCNHPFVDGNGRIGRVLNNLLLIKEGYVPINIKFIDRKKYYEAFKEFDLKGETNIMEEIVARAITNSYYKRLAYLEGKKIISLSEYAKVNKISHSNLINKAGRQTIEAFLEKGIWKIGI